MLKVKQWSTSTYIVVVRKKFDRDAAKTHWRVTDQLQQFRVKALKRVADLRGTFFPTLKLEQNQSPTSTGLHVGLT